MCNHQSYISDDDAKKEMEKIPNKGTNRRWEEYVESLNVVQLVNKVYNYNHVNGHKGKMVQTIYLRLPMTWLS